MANTYTRNSNLLSSKNVSFNKKIVLENSRTKNTLDEKQCTLEKQLEIIEKQHEQILAQAESDKQRILDDAKKASLDIEKTAYEEGYSQGLKNGYEDGYKEAYEKTAEEIQLEFEEKIKEATEILLSSQSLVTDFAMSKKNEILNLALTIAEQILSKELKKSKSMDSLFEKALLEVKDRKSLVIKVNPIHEESIEAKIKALKDELSLTDDIHVMGLSSVNQGDAIIESESGTVLVGLNVALENIKAELL